MRNYQGSKNSAETVIISHYRCQLPHDDPVQAHSDNKQTVHWRQHFKIIFNNLGCHSSRLFQSFASNSAQTPDKQETIFVKARSGLRMPGCCAAISLVFDKTTFHYCKSLRIFRQHKFCKLNLIFPDRNTLDHSSIL